MLPGLGRLICWTYGHSPTCGHRTWRDRIRPPTTITHLIRRNR